MKVCSAPGCPTLHRNTGPRCSTHAAEHERRRGTRQQRGYDSRHLKLRAAWEPRVEAGEVTCWRCGNPIAPGTAWDLGHDDRDRTRYRGPEHANQCNRSAAGRSAHQ